MARKAVPVLTLLLLAAACSSPAAEPTELTLVTHDSFVVSEGTLQEFTAETGIDVRLLKAGDAGELVSQAIISKDNPIGDVLFGIDNTFLSRALNEQLFVAYESPLLVDVPDELEIDDGHRVTPIDYGDVCINYDRSVFDNPPSLDELIDPRLSGQLVVQNPGSSSPGLAFLLATIATYGEGGWQDYWQSLFANDVVVTSGWTEAYEGRFSGGYGGGDLPLVVSYASSPPAEVLFSDPPVDEAPTGVVVESCFRQIEFAGILKESQAARDLIDFMLGATFQEDIPLNMFVFPANETAELPEVFVEHAVVAEDPLSLDPDLIEAERETWIREWTELAGG